MEVNTEGEDGLDMEALVDEYLEAVIMTSPGGGSLSQLSSPLQIGWRSEVSDSESEEMLSRRLSGWLLSLSLEKSKSSGSSLEVSVSSSIEQKDEDYDADISSNCDQNQV